MGLDSSTPKHGSDDHDASSKPALSRWQPATRQARSVSTARPALISWSLGTVNGLLKHLEFLQLAEGDQAAPERDRADDARRAVAIRTSDRRSAH